MCFRMFSSEIEKKQDGTITTKTLSSSESKGFLLGFGLFRTTQFLLDEGAWEDESAEQTIFLIAIAQARSSKTPWSEQLGNCIPATGCRSSCAFSAFLCCFALLASPPPTPTCFASSQLHLVLLKHRWLDSDYSSTVLFLNLSLFCNLLFPNSDLTRKNSEDNSKRGQV
uniref:Uncharacterized protein n=1 Tax=Sphaerodactylus townsendi TaxID=933632 RepID=A0ACB8E805_9SAUR